MDEIRKVTIPAPVKIGDGNTGLRGYGCLHCSDEECRAGLTDFMQERNQKTYEMEYQQIFNPENRFWAFYGKGNGYLCSQLLLVPFSIPAVTVGGGDYRSVSVYAPADGRRGGIRLEDLPGRV